MTYALLDSGAGRKLEQVGPYLVDRQAPVAHWQPRLGPDTWKRADAVHVRSERGGGHWDVRRELPDSWPVELSGITLLAKLTPFGHMGLFPEHAVHWEWLAEIAAQSADDPPLEVLNLFAYTGGPTLACARAGMRVTHVDAAHGVVDWAKANAEHQPSRVAPIRWIVDDCGGFARRELRRGRRYDGVLLDPPSFGRGPRGNVFKIETDIGALLDQCAELLSDRPRFVLFTCHSPGFSPLVLENLLGERLDRRGARVESAEMVVSDAGLARPLPAGSYCRWRWE